MLIEREIIRLYKWLCFDLGARPSCPCSRPCSCPHSHIDRTHLSYNHASDVDQVDGAHSTNDTMDHSTVWRGALCEGHYAANVDQATVWPGVLCEGHYAADVDRATVWPRCTRRRTLCG